MRQNHDHRGEINVDNRGAWAKLGPKLMSSSF